MNNEKIINQAIRMYFQGENWQEYLKKECRKNKSFQELLKKIAK